VNCGPAIYSYQPEPNQVKDIQEMQKDSLFERIGGLEAIMAAADLFYEKVMRDPLLARFFQGIDMKRQNRKMVAFMTWAFDGPTEYKGRDLRTAHRDLVKSHGLNDSHFDAVAIHLSETLKELGVAPALIDEALAIVATTRDEVLNR